MPQQSLTFAHLVTAVSTEVEASILDEWTWLVGLKKRLKLVTACGDIFFEDELKGTIHFLDVSTPEITPVAETKQAFELLLTERAFIQTYLHPDRVEMLRARGLFLKENQVYSFCTPLSLGGQISAENIDVTDVEIHFSIAGQIESQIADIPLGTPVTGIRFADAPHAKSWWKFW